MTTWSWGARGGWVFVVLLYLAAERGLAGHPQVARWAPQEVWGRRPATMAAGPQRRAPESGYVRVALARLGGGRMLTADVLWVQALQYLGTPEEGSKGYRQFAGMVDDVLEVDPGFVQAYASGSAVLMWVVKDADAALALLRRGVKACPSEGVLSLYLAAFTLYRLERFHETIPVLEQMVEREDHPAALELMLAALYVKVGDLRKAQWLWRWMRDFSRSVENRREALERLTPPAPSPAGRPKP